jgi:hypothetical protein
MMDKFSMRMEELERKVANKSHNIEGPPNQVASTSGTSSNIFRHEEQDICMAGGTEERATHVEARTSNTGQPNSNSPEYVHEVEALSNNTNNQGPPVLTDEDVNMGEQPNMNSQLHELNQAPLAFVGEDINMGGQPTNNNNQSEHVNMDGQVMDTGRLEHVRWGKQRKLPLDEDEEDFGLDEDEENFSMDEDDQDKGKDDSEPEIRFSVPKPIMHFQRPRGGAGPRLKMNSQTSTSANPVPNIPNITPSPLQSLGITSEQVAAIAEIVMAVQNKNSPKSDIPSRSSIMNVSGTIKEQSRRERSPRRRVLAVRAQFPSQHKRDMMVFR